MMELAQRWEEGRERNGIVGELQKKLEIVISLIG